VVWLEPPHAASSAAIAIAPARAPARETRVIDGCHSQSSLAADMLRGDGSESDGP
jgi:hypothetical protein